MQGRIHKPRDAKDSRPSLETGRGAWKRLSLGVSRRNQRCAHLTSDFWPLDLGETNHIAMFEAPQSVALCSHRKFTHQENRFFGCRGLSLRPPQPLLMPKLLSTVTHQLGEGTWVPWNRAGWQEGPLPSQPASAIRSPQTFTAANAWASSPFLPLASEPRPHLPGAGPLCPAHLGRPSSHPLFHCHPSGRPVHSQQGPHRGNELSGRPT